MLAIRLQRNGRSGYPTYRIVVQEAQRHPLSGRIVAHVGSYNPHTKETVLDKEKVETYLGNGAQPSSRVVRILTSEGVKMPKWVKEVAKKELKTRNPDKWRRTAPKEEVVAEEVAVVGEAEVAVEAPVEKAEAEAEAEVSAE